MDEAYLECPYYGARQMRLHLQRLGHKVGRHKIARLMGKMGLAAIYQKPNTSRPNPENTNASISTPSRPDSTYMPDCRATSSTIIFPARTHRWLDEPP